MKRKLIPLVSVVAVALAALTALAGSASAHKANDHGGWFGPGFFAQQTVVKGTVTAVNASAGTFTATVDVMNRGFDGGHFFNGRGDDGNCQGWGPGFRGNDGFGGRFHGDQMTPTTTTMTPSTTTMTTPTTPSTVTITTNSSTKFDVNGNTSATIANLAAGDRFIASFAALPGQGSGNEGSSVRRSHWDQGGSTTVPTTPALEVIAESPPQLYAFVGTVATAPTALPGSLSVTVSQSLPAGLFTGTQTFQIGVADAGVRRLGQLTVRRDADHFVGRRCRRRGNQHGRPDGGPSRGQPAAGAGGLHEHDVVDQRRPAHTTPAATEMAKRMKTESFNRALKRLLKHHRKAQRAHHAHQAHRHHAKA